MPVDQGEAGQDGAEAQDPGDGGKARQELVVLRGVVQHPQLGEARAYEKEPEEGRVVGQAVGDREDPIPFPLALDGPDVSALVHRGLRGDGLLQLLGSGAGVELLDQLFGDVGRHDQRKDQKERDEDKKQDRPDQERAGLPPVEEQEENAEKGVVEQDVAVPDQ